MATTNRGDDTPREPATQDGATREAPAPNLGPSTDVTLGDETMELLAYGDLEGAKARHDGTPAKPTSPT